MKTFKELFEQSLTEAFVNLINNDPKKIDYVDAVWDIIQRSYAKIGGIHGSGFGSKDEMMKKIPFWKVMKKDGKVVAVFLYRDKNGRKRVASGTDGSKEGKQMYVNAMKQEFGRGYSETSDRALMFIENLIGVDELVKIMTRPSKVSKILNKEIFLLDELPESEWASDNDWLFNFGITETHPIYPYLYLRKIGGVYHVKALLGKTGLDIV